MCGIVGTIARTKSGFYAQDMDLLEQMLILDQLRGKDSAGAMAAFRNGDQMVVKHASKHISLMFETNEWRNFRMKVINQGIFCIGHNRAATRGAHTTDNAHPFVEGRISLVHNGTISNQKALEGERKDIIVDSNAIAHALNEDTIDNVIGKIDGAFALVWYNNEDEKLYAIRNDERPLHLVTTPNFYFLMSEPWMCVGPYARQIRHKQEIESVDSIEPGHLLSWDMDGKMLESREVSLLPKKSFSGTGTTETQDGYASWSRGPLQPHHKYQQATKKAVEEGTEALPEDPIPPFDTGVTPPDQSKVTTSIREVLLRSAQQKASREQKLLTTCALTQVGGSRSMTMTGQDLSEKSTAGDRHDSRTDLIAFEENMQAQQRNIIVQNEFFKPGDFTLVKIHEVFRQGKFVRWTGKIRMPGKPMLDASGVLPEGITKPEDWATWIETMCTGHVNYCTYTTNGGPSVVVSKLMLAGYTDVHGEDIPWVIWNRALVTGCDGCSGRLFDWERPYTVVKTKGVMMAGRASGMINSLRCICPDCLLKVLPEGDIRNAYSKKYYEAKTKYDAQRNADGRPAPHRHPPVQDRKQLGEGTSPENGATLTLPAPPTIQ